MENEINLGQASFQNAGAAAGQTMASVIGAAKKKEGEGKETPAPAPGAQQAPAVAPEADKKGFLPAIKKFWDTL